MLCGVVTTVLMVTGKRDQKFDIITLTDIKNIYYSLVLDASYLLEKLTFAMLFSDKDTCLAMQAAHRSRVDCVRLYCTIVWFVLFLCSRRDYKISENGLLFCTSSMFLTADGSDLDITSSILE